MKYLIEVDIPDGHAFLHRPHTDVEVMLAEDTGRRFTTHDGVEIKVKKQVSKKKESK